MSGHASLRRACLLFLIALTGLPLFAGAVSSWVQGTVVLVETSGGVNNAPYFYFSLSNQPTTGCSRNGLFEFSPVIFTNKELRDRMVSLIVAAKTTGRQLTVSYDAGTAQCSDGGYPYVSQVIMH